MSPRRVASSLPLLRLAASQPESERAARARNLRLGTLIFSTLSFFLSLAHFPFVSPRLSHIIIIAGDMLAAAADAAAGGAEHLRAPASAEAAAGRELLPTPAPSARAGGCCF
jgi:hypothetical protein